MKLFTTDLDRTLIFSNRTIGNCTDVRCVELFEGKEQSFMSNKQIDMLHELKESTHIIPVTTRSQMQYERVSFFQQELIPSYAVMANGGIIFKDGKRDTQWDEIVQQNMKEALPICDFPTRFEMHRAHDFFLREYEVEGLFYMLAVDLATLRHEELRAFQDDLATEGWTSYLHGRKFYALPSTLTKEAAVKYVASQLAHTEHIAAGDSMMDLGMMQFADVGYTPKHGEVYEKYGDTCPVNVILKEGAEFAEAMLAQILATKTTV
ncbi:MAG: HAD family hydrolase [Caryophanon sp.]|nr:HAD family hydrolase [Caryophanon sp.]